MAFWDYFKQASVSDQLDIDLLRDAAETSTKDYDYSAYTPEAATTYQPMVIASPGGSWLGGSEFSTRAELLLKKCPISKACIDIRAQGVSGISLDVTGAKSTKDMLNSPNSVDKTIAAALKSWEVQLAVGGDLYLFFDLRVPGLPQVSSLRQDLVVNNIKAQQYEYRPGALTNGSTPPEFIFRYDKSGATIAAFDRSNTAFKGYLQRISYYDPLTPLQGAGAGDSALRSVQIWLSADDLIKRKFQSGGSKNGYFTAKNSRTDADLAAIRAQMQAINQNGDLNVLAGGMDFTAAQLTFNELDLVKIRDKMGDAICTAFNVNSTMVNVGQATHANLRGMDKIFYRNFIGPEAKWLVGQLEWGIRKYVDATASVIVDETGIQHIQDDIRDNVVALAPLGILTIDECRALVGQPPLPDGQGKALATSKAAVPDAHTGLGQPDEKPGGDTSFNADSGDRGDSNDD